MENSLNTSVQYIKAVGPKRAESFSQIGINNVRDLLFYFPTRYLDRSTLISSIQVLEYVRNGYEGEVTIVGEVISSEVIRYGKKQLFKVKMKDKSGVFECVWFQGIKYFKDSFQTGVFFAVSAKPVVTRYGHIQFVHPDFDKLASNESTDFFNTGKIIPFYRLPKELKAKNIGDFSLRKIINNAVENFADNLVETLPYDLINKYGLPDLIKAVKSIHFPDTIEELNEAKRRFKYEELFFIEILVALRKYFIKVKINGIQFKIKAEPIKKFLNTLPFELTRDQLKVLNEIRNDMEKKSPMNRLLQGDVGSGKTIVALIAMLIAVENGFQAVIMAPTEILANQHFINISGLLKDFNINISLLLGGQQNSKKKNNLKEIELNKADIIIGTHALLEEGIIFNKLGLVVIDEQHRFGVAQRSRLIRKSNSPDVLIMTATPIPRTLSMTVYGDLDVSIIKEMPKDRKKIKTVLRSENKLKEIYQFVIDKSDEGYQTFIVYPLVEDSEKLDLKSAVTYYDNLREGYLKNLNVGLLHGKMKWNEKEEIMKQFAQKEFDVLVSTTVIEVGIDIPDANIIIINEAQRFGLSQLHQLRGRVGRSSQQAYCILVSNIDPKYAEKQFAFNFDFLSASQIEKNKAAIRLNAMIRIESGFELSEIDLKLRGPGDILGTKQSGYPDFKYADLISDTELIITAKEDAFKIINDDPALEKNENKLIRENLAHNYKENLKYSNIA